MRANEPVRGPKYRSRAFQVYLLQQTPERRAEILAGERSYNASIEGPATARGAAEQDYDDALHGYEVTPAGPGQKHSDHPSRMPRLRSRA